MLVICHHLPDNPIHPQEVNQFMNSLDKYFSNKQVGFIE